MMTSAMSDTAPNQGALLGATRPPDPTRIESISIILPFLPHEGREQAYGATGVPSAG
jgi:hypothetical protein